MSAITPVTSFRESSVSRPPFEKISCGWNLTLLEHVFTFVSPEQLTGDIRRVSHCWNKTSMSPKVVKSQLQNCSYLAETQLAKSFLSLWLSKEEFYSNPLMIILFFRFQQKKTLERGFYYHLAINMLRANLSAGGSIYEIDGLSLKDMNREELIKAGEGLLKLVPHSRDPDLIPFIKELARFSVQTYIQELEQDSPSFTDLCTIRHNLLSHLPININKDAYPMPFLTANAFKLILTLFLNAEGVKPHLTLEKLK